MKIREATLLDAADIASLHIETERQAYENTVPAFLENVSGIEGRVRIWEIAISATPFYNCVLIIRSPSGLLTGFLSGKIQDINPNGRLNGIYVSKQYQRTGVGRRLFTGLINGLSTYGAQSLVCTVPEINTTAREFFAWSGGFEMNRHRVKRGVHSINMIDVRWKALDRVADHLNASKFGI